MTKQAEPSIQIVSRAPDGGERRSTITGATDLARLGMSLRTLSEDLAHTALDEAARARVHRQHLQAVRLVEGSVDGALGEELRHLGVLDIPDAGSPTALRLANAQLLGWLNGLFQQLEEAIGPDEPSEPDEPGQAA